MASRFASFLEETLDRELPNLRALTAAQAAERPSKPGAWSRKEELGHLIDSATNNHIRLVRGSTEAEYRGPGYIQNNWVRAHAYHDLPWEMVLDFWERYNRMLVEVIRRIPEDRLETPCYIGSNAAAKLGFIIEDYILHAQHHIDHILGRPVLTAYPGQSNPD